MRDTLLNVLKVGGAVVLLLIGFILLFIPGPGLLLIAIGLVWLGVIEAEDIRRWTDRIRRRFKK